MALIKLNFCPGGVNSFTDSLGNTYAPDANGQIQVNPDLVNMSDFLNAGFTAVVDTASSSRPAIQFAGQRYFDTSLGTAGKPIWVNATKTGWVDATGTTV